jgi:hypothetical protein
MSKKIPMTDQARSARAKLGNASRKYGADDDRTLAARAEWDAERWLAAVAVALTAPRPELSADQNARLCELISSTSPAA